mgnify:CR=1 FL=1
MSDDTKVKRLKELVRESLKMHPDGGINAGFDMIVHHKSGSCKVIHEEQNNLIMENWKLFSILCHMEECIE